MDMFWKLLEKSVVTSGVIAVGLVGTACYCVVAQVPLPDYFGIAIGTVIGYFFSQKASEAQARRVS
jgi:hypothetical protein